MRLLFFFAILLFVINILSAQTFISGVVNNYTSVTEISDFDITVGDASAFGVGDKVLIIQMKGA